jgi:REP element-mobilizing transposase RayT
MWNDTDVPLGYLITFRTYGTWLHGDIRGAVDRSNNVYGQPKIAHTPARRGFAKTIMPREPVLLNAKRRSSVENSIRDTCRIRGWAIYAVNVRTNHAHVVVAIGCEGPHRALSALKANATRQMREDSCWSSNETPWVDKGSVRYLWNEKSIERAIDYVNNGQGDELPKFD